MHFPCLYGWQKRISKLKALNCKQQDLALFSTVQKVSFTDLQILEQRQPKCCVGLYPPV
jgi:hypothetical protein